MNYNILTNFKYENQEKQISYDKNITLMLNWENNDVNNKINFIRRIGITTYGKEAQAKEISFLAYKHIIDNANFKKEIYKEQKEAW
ncbi:hypothetical protein CWO85_01175 [Candidatus Phytoplasma ziziphi]|uniref:Uncharacterized protein n=1 Tax=Ziziphus jujuba witches'-broom phytoplasma TaxID=135727 RepID=A0A660HM95_ZIZJU|nr:hypothetical protein [Candidatus Phytoplasma ziziphi]AYJ01145.1 hypothetical protein CWO85_01175 [Candidatus Phytoplasma ziziphi]